jgi:uncharacterized protein (DUF433 family)
VATTETVTASDTTVAAIPPRVAATREALHRAINALPQADLAEAARLLDSVLARTDDSRGQALIERWIRQHPHKRGPAEAVVAESFESVHALVPYLDAVGGDVDRVAEDYDVPREAVEAAIAFYRRHRALIDARVAENAPD